MKLNKENSSIIAVILLALLGSGFFYYSADYISALLVLFFGGTISIIFDFYRRLQHNIDSVSNNLKKQEEFIRISKNELLAAIKKNYDKIDNLEVENLGKFFNLKNDFEFKFLNFKLDIEKELKNVRESLETVRRWQVDLRDEIEKVGQRKENNLNDSTKSNL